MAKLLVHESAGVREFELVDNEVHIGRELDNNLRLADPSISRHHCVIRQTGNGYEIQDLQSSNGVLLNGSRVQTAPMRDGDRITLGQIQITFMDPAEQGATVAVQRSEVQAPPTGTVRMSPEEMAKVHGTNAGMPSQGAATNPVEAAPRPAAPLPPSPSATAPAPRQPMPELRAPEFGHFTDPGVAAAKPGPQPMAVTGRPAAVRLEDAGSQPGVPIPAPPSGGFLSKFLPPVPDDAQPTGERGDFITRLIAAVIDGAVMIPVIIVVVVLSIAVGMLARFVPFLGCLGALLGMLLYAVAFLGYFLYFVPRCISRNGATIGKKMMKLRVVPEDDPHGRLSFGQALIRQLCHALNFGIGYLLAFGAERKAVHDMITKTIVIKVDR